MMKVNPLHWEPNPQASGQVWNARFGTSQLTICRSASRETGSEFGIWVDGRKVNSVFQSPCHAMSMAMQALAQ